MKKDKLIRDFKIYNFVMTNIWQLLTTVLIGFGIGWLLEKLFDSEKNLYMLFSILIALMIGIINFFYSLYRKMRSLQKREETNDSTKYIKYEDEEEKQDDQD